MGQTKKREEWETGELALKPYSSQALLHDMREALKVIYPNWKKEQLSAIGTHSLRSGCVTQMYRAGATFIHGKGWLRHKAKNAVFRYIATDLEDQRHQLSHLGYEEA